MSTLYKDTNALKSYLARVKATRSHLQRALGSQMRAQDAELARISGGEPVKQPVSQIEQDAALLDSPLVTSLLGAVFANATGVPMPSSLFRSLGKGGSGASRGQALSDVALALGRALQRNS